MCVNHLIVRRGRVPLRACRPERRQAHLHAIDASPFSRLERRDENRTPSQYREANGLVLKRLEVESVVEIIITTSPNLSWYMLEDQTMSRRRGTATVHQPFRRRHRVAAVSSLPSRSVTMGFVTRGLQSVLTYEFFSAASTSASTASPASTTSRLRGRVGRRERRGASPNSTPAKGLTQTLWLTRDVEDCSLAAFGDDGAGRCEVSRPSAQPC